MQPLYHQAFPYFKRNGLFAVPLQSRVASRYEWRTGAKAKRCPGLGARPVRLES